MVDLAGHTRNGRFPRENWQKPTPVHQVSGTHNGFFKGAGVIKPERERMAGIRCPAIPEQSGSLSFTRLLKALYASLPARKP
jgi:hypothetical protein